MKEQWTIGTTKFHTIVGDPAVLEAKKAEILKEINDAATEERDINDIEGVEFVETYIADSVVECTTGINDEEN